MNAKNKEYLMNYLDIIYELIGNFDTILDILKLLCVGKTDKNLNVSNASEMVMKNIDKMLYNLEESSASMEKLLQEASTGIYFKIKVYKELEELKDLQGINKKITKKLKDAIDIVGTYYIYIDLILGENAPQIPYSLPERVIKSNEGKSQDEIFEKLIADIKENTLGLSEIANDILRLNNIRG